MKNTKDMLEKLVDENRLSRIIGNLEDISYEKADHLRSNWQDENTAKIWDKASVILANTQNKLKELGL